MTRQPHPLAAQPLRAVIVDDEAPARDRMQELLTQDEEVEVVAICSGGQAAIDAIEKLRPDLVFLDIQMPGVDGLDVIEAIGPERMPVVVFVTAFNHYAVQAFEVGAVDFLLKPFDRARFERSLQRAKARSAAARAQPLDRLLVRDGERIHVVKTIEVHWIEAVRNLVALHLGPREYLVRSTLSAMETRLDPRTFVRIHRDTIVNLEFIRSFHRWQGSQFRVVLEGGVERPIGRKYQAHLEERLGKL